jgi:hypothetical protein
MMASVSLAGMFCRRADRASTSAKLRQKLAQTRSKFFITRFSLAQLSADIFRKKHPCLEDWAYSSNRFMQTRKLRSSAQLGS